MRYAEYGRYDANGTWEQYPSIPLVGMNANGSTQAEFWLGNRKAVDVDGLNRLNLIRMDNPLSCSVVLPTMDTGVKAWVDGKYVIKNRAKAIATRGFSAIVTLEIINEDDTGYTGSDATYVAQVGFDPAVSSETSSETAAADGKNVNGYPRIRADGGYSKWVPFDGSSGAITIGVITYDGSNTAIFTVIGAPPPWGNWIDPPWAYNKQPYVLSQAQLSINRPIFLY
jgi:hypothetical protein